MVGVVSHVKSVTIADIANTDIVRPSDWNSGHVGAATLSGNTIGVSTLSGTNFVFSGGDNVTLSGVQGANAATIGISGGTAATNSLNVSAGTTSNNLTNIVFSNSNNFSFGLNGSTITASYTVPSTANLISRVNLSAGTTSNNLTAAVFSNSNNITFGMDGSTITASASFAGAGTISYFANYSNLSDVVQVAFTNQSSFIAPFILPLPLSISYLRFLVFEAFSNISSFATSATTSITNSLVSSFAVGVYVQNTGLSSLSLSNLVSTSIGSTLAWTLTANSNGSEYSVSGSASYPIGGGFSTTSTSYVSTRSRFDLHSSGFGNFDVGAKSFMALDFPFATSLSAGAYWMAIGNSSTSGGAGTQQVNSASIFFLTGASAPLQLPGSATNVTNQQRIGLGVFSTNASGMAANIALASISLSASGIGQALFQAIRQI